MKCRIDPALIAGHSFLKTLEQLRRQTYVPLLNVQDKPVKRHVRQETKTIALN